jgi:hypothetical protein
MRTARLINPGLLSAVVLCVVVGLGPRLPSYAATNTRAGTWVPTTAMSDARSQAGVTPLQDGRVLVVGADAASLCGGVARAASAREACTACPTSAPRWRPPHSASPL